jgi:hypothetical protein
MRLTLTVSEITATKPVTPGNEGRRGDRLDTREWQTLRRMGIGTTGALIEAVPSQTQ